MPYIKKSDKIRLAETGEPISPGELNFAVTSLLIGYVKRMGLNYETLNEVVGALECSKLEFQRRVINKYEDSKIKENGDVYPVIL